MKRVRVRRAELVEKVRTNRTKHEETYKKALTVFREEAVDKLRGMLKAAEDGGEIEQYLGLPEPQKHTDDYDQVIAMLEMSTEDEIDLDALDFARYVLDKWGWQANFEATTGCYASKFKG